MKKNIDELLESDFQTYRVWKFVNNDSAGELLVTPIKKLPTSNLQGKIVFSLVEIANGDSVWAMIGNLDINNLELTKYFMTLSFFKNGAWFHLARYHDPDCHLHGPNELAIFLGVEESAIFPIKYDIQFTVHSEAPILQGLYEYMPSKLLTRAEIVALAVP